MPSGANVSALKQSTGSEFYRDPNGEVSLSVLHALALLGPQKVGAAMELASPA